LEKRVSIIIPVFNEEERIARTIKGLIDAGIKCLGEIIIVDDGSTDKTRDEINSLGLGSIIYIRLNRNYGKGAALRKGLEISRYPIIAFLDGDLGDTSKEIIKLIEPVYKNKADVSIAVFPTPSTKGGFGILKKVSRLGVWVLTNRYMENPICGQRVFKKSVFSNIEIPDRFGVEIGMTIDILNQGFKVWEVPVQMSHRETKRDLQGCVHRGKELIDVLRVLMRKFYKHKNAVNRG